MARKWPACKIRQTEAGPITVLAYSGTRQTGKRLFVCGYCESDGGGFRVEVEVRPADRAGLANMLLGLPPDGIER